MMYLSEEVRRKIIETALTFLGQPYSPSFNCIDFVREVYARVGIQIPKISPQITPRRCNILREDLKDPPFGHIIFLRDLQDDRPRSWTHVGILLPEKKCIHCSLFFGQKVVISALDELFKRYHFAESIAAE